MNLQIHTFTTGPVMTNSYVVIDPAAHVGVIIDAPPDSQEGITQALADAGVAPAALLLTHTHWDHTADAAPLKTQFPEMLIYVHPDDEYRLVEPMRHTVWPLPFTLQPVAADRHLRHGDRFTLGHINFNILHAPGHSEGSIVFHDEANRVAFSGDVLFSGSIGRTDLPGGDFEALMRSIATRLMPLHDATRILSGHGPETTIGQERERNPFALDWEGYLA